MPVAAPKRRPELHLGGEPRFSPQDREALANLEDPLDPAYLHARFEFEREYEARTLRQETRIFSLQRWLSSPALIRGGLRLIGMHERSRRNALSIEVRHHDVPLPHLPEAFDGFRLLHLSDLHFGMSDEFTEALIRSIETLDYDLCVLTGDYRALTYGPYDIAIAGLRRLKPHLRRPAYAVLGNHDTLRMAPLMEAMGYRMLLNRSAEVPLGGDRIYLAGIDDAKLRRTGNFPRARSGIPAGAVSILLAHRPETYRPAAEAGFDLMLCGHTHGGQLCLPGGLPVRTETRSPRRFVRGSWRHGSMIGYTSVGAGTCVIDARLNCPPEVTLHNLRRAPAR